VPRPPGLAPFPAFKEIAYAGRENPENDDPHGAIGYDLDDREGGEKRGFIAHFFTAGRKFSMTQISALGCLTE